MRDLSVIQPERIDNLTRLPDRASHGTELPGAVLVLKPEFYPEGRQLTALQHEGIRTLEIDQPILVSGDDARAAISFLRFLRDAASAGLRVIWRGDLRLDGIDDALVAHLSPPEGRPDHSTWRSRHRFGLFYWRRGPDFILVRDRRRQEMGARLTIEGAGDLEAFSRLLPGCRLIDLSPDLRTSAGALVASGVGVQAGGWATILQTRLPTWPIPYTAV